MQVANHPDLVTAEFDKQNLEYPSAEQLIAECGKVALLDRMLTKLHAGGHKVRPCHPMWQSRRVRPWELCFTRCHQAQHTANLLVRLQ
jgi:hypothetical protein